ncbi:MAG: crossover junction endodeoxyribonuclease RuvC [Planctomycetes bacterium]|nr:crossover junction endodeoxyribonuclease RuvC [Planctomycetota bacterium]
MAVRILGIDPGTVVAGCACLEVDLPDADAVRPAGPRPLALRASNVVRRGATGALAARLVLARAIRLGRRAAVGVRLAQLADAFEAILDECRPDEIALEEAFGGKSVQAALRIGEARGVVLATAYRRGLAVHQYPPARIKRSVTGSGAADKSAVARMAAHALGIAAIDGPADVADAVAVALTRLEERRAPDLRG